MERSRKSGAYKWSGRSLENRSLEKEIPQLKPNMKLLVFAALIVAALAFPAEEHRSKRSLFAAPGIVVSGGSSIVKGPSGVIAADAGAIAAPALAAAPYFGYGYGVAPAYGHGAVVVGPSAYAPGYVKAGGHLFY